MFFSCLMRARNLCVLFVAVLRCGGNKIFELGNQKKKIKKNNNNKCGTCMLWLTKKIKIKKNYIHSKFHEGSLRILSLWPQLYYFMQHVIS